MKEQIVVVTKHGENKDKLHASKMGELTVRLVESAKQVDDLSNLVDGLTDQKLALETNLNDAKSTHHSEIEILKAAHQKMIGSVVEDMEVSGNSLGKDIQRLQNDRMKHLEEVYGAKVDSIQKLMEVSKAELETLKTSHKTLLHEKETLAKQLNTSQKETMEARTFGQTLKEEKYNLEQKIMEEKNENERKLISLKVSMAQEKQSEFATLHAEHEEKLKAVNDSFVHKVKNIVAMMKAAHESQVQMVTKEVNEKHEQILADRVGHQENYWREFLNTKEASFDEAYKALQTKFANAQTKHGQKMHAIKDELSQQSNELEEVSKQSLEWADAVANLSDTHKVERI